MKGIVFTEFMEMVESGHGMDMVDTLIEETNPPSGGVYVATGTYDHAELVAMVVELSKRTDTEVSDLLVAFGRYLIPRFQQSFPTFFEPHDSLFSFLQSVHDYIHVEVRKLYPDAELPHIECAPVSENVMHLNYRSKRHLHEFGRGLIEGAAEAYNSPISITTEPIDEDSMRFEITLVD